MKKGIEFISIESNAYQERLKYISYKPMCLYVKGKLPDNVKKAATGVLGLKTKKLKNRKFN